MRPIGPNESRDPAPALAFPLVLIATAALLLAPLLWHAPRCTGPTQADLCPIGGR